MTYSLAAASVVGAPLTTTFTTSTSIQSGQTAANAVNIGNLEEQNDTVTITNQGATQGVPVTSNFTVNSGDTVFLSSQFSDFVDQDTTHVQLFDSNNNLIADNQGTTAQQQAFLQWSSTGLTPAAGNYSVVATPAALTPPAALTVNTVAQQGTSLSVNSQLTGADPSEYYNFSLGDGNNLKLAFDAGANLDQTRVQLYDSNGNLIADSEGNVTQQANYLSLTSNLGLSATPGNYSVKVSYATGVSPDQSPQYNFQLYSGTNYAVVYKTNVTAPPTNNSAAASVTAASDAQLYTRQAYNQINDTAASAVNIGWLAENKSQLNVQSQLSTADATDYYQFTFQQGNNLKLAFQNVTNTSNARIQLLNSTGTQVIADNEGTAAQKATYAALTSSTGITANTGQYVVKVTYGAGADQSQAQTYNFQVYSGTSYAASYETYASAQTYGNALLEGNVTGAFNASSAAASYLNNLSQGSVPDLFQTLSTLV